MGAFITVTAAQDGTPVPVEIHYDRVMWSGLSWAVGEIRRDRIAPGVPLDIRVTSAETDSLRLDVRVYRVEY
jgi:hypothetical protein